VRQIGQLDALAGDHVEQQRRQLSREKHWMNREVTDPVERREQDPVRRESNLTYAAVALISEPEIGA
jgi:hypothetical protein